MKEYETRSIISFQETYDIYATYSGQISDIFIDKGDIITPGAIIAAYSSGTVGRGAVAAELSVNIERIQNQLEALTLNKTVIMDKLQALGANPNDLSEYQYAIKDAEATLSKALDELSTARQLAGTPFDDYDYQQLLAETEKEWNRKLVEAEKMQVLYEAGAVALVEATSAKLAAEDAESVYIAAIGELERAREKASQASQKKVADAENVVSGARAALERAEKSFELAQEALMGQIDETRRALENEIKMADLDIERQNIDLRAAEISLASSSEDMTNIRAGNQSSGLPSADTLGAGLLGADTHGTGLPTADTPSIGLPTADTLSIGLPTADTLGVVISVEIKRGQFIAQGETIATVGKNNHMFTSEIVCMESVGNFIEIGDEANVYKNGTGTPVKAVVYDIASVGDNASVGDMLNISIICETDELNDGEYVAVKFQKQTKIYDIVVPNEAIFKEGMNNYVWTVGSRQGALGTEYFTAKTRVIIADTDDYCTAIAKGLEIIYPTAPVVISADRDLAVNGRVRRMD